MRAEITLDGVGRERIVIDGHDLTKGFRGLTLRAGVGEIPTLELEGLLLDISTLAGGVRVIVDQRTEEALIALGWTPPPNEPGGVSC